MREGRGEGFKVTDDDGYQFLSVADRMIKEADPNLVLTVANAHFAFGRTDIRILLIHSIERKL